MTSRALDIILNRLCEESGAFDGYLFEILARREPRAPGDQISITLINRELLWFQRAQHEPPTIHSQNNVKIPIDLT